MKTEPAHSSTAGLVAIFVAEREGRSMAKHEFFELEYNERKH